MKTGFVTCVQLGKACIEAIYADGGSLDLIATLPDDRARNKSGRVYLDSFCAQHDVPLLKTEHVNDAEAVRAFSGLDWLFIIGWSQIAGIGVLSAPAHGVIGMHPTLLPRGRGRASIPWAILKGLSRTGVTAFVLDEGVDTGPIVGQEEIALDPTTTATTLYAAVQDAHVSLMRRIFRQISDGSIASVPQREVDATVWPGRTPEDGRIDVQGSVVDAERLVRAVTRPYPGAFHDDSTGSRWIVWSARVVPEAPAGPHLEFRDGYLEMLDFERSGPSST